LGVMGLTVARVEAKIVHLTATRITRYEDFGRSSDDEREVDVARRIVPFQEMVDDDFTPLFNEVDAIGFVASLGDASKASKGFQTVTLCDINLSCVRLMVWGGVVAMGLKDILTQGSVVACKDLEWRCTAKGQLPALYVREYSSITANPKDPSVLSQINDFKTKMGKDFLSSAMSAVRRGARFRPNAPGPRAPSTLTTNKMSTISTPSPAASRSSSPAASTTSSVASAWNVPSDVMNSQHVRNQEKLAKLDAVAGSELHFEQLSPSQTILPQYKPPRVRR